MRGRSTNAGVRQENNLMELSGSEITDSGVVHNEQVKHTLQEWSPGCAGAFRSVQCPTLAAPVPALMRLSVERIWHQDIPSAAMPRRGRHIAAIMSTKIPRPCRIMVLEGLHHSSLGTLDALDQTHL